MTKPPFRRVVVDRAAADLPFTTGLLSRLPSTVTVEMADEGAPPPKERLALYVTVKQGAFLKECPCTPGAVRCGYYVFSPVFMCPYRCSYCFLRFYAPDEPLTLYANLEDAESEFREAAAKFDHPVRIGTGEFADSLALDPWTGHAEWIANLVRDYPHVLMELKTKSALAEVFLSTPPLPNLVAAWSLNPPEVAATQELGAATIAQRLAAAAAVAGAGRPVAFHFDPIILVENWRAHYSRTIEELFAAVDPALIRWISLGTLRFPRRFLDQWGPALRGNPIFFEEFVLGEDGKLRYFWPERKKVYAFMAEEIKRRSGGRVEVYLCMESPAMWQAAFGKAPEEREVEHRLCGEAEK